MDEGEGVRTLVSFIIRMLSWQHMALTPKKHMEGKMGKKWNIFRFDELPTNQITPRHLNEIHVMNLQSIYSTILLGENADNI